MSGEPLADDKQRAKITDETIRKADGSLRMDAYYYGFDSTGCEPVDRVLAAVALAGKLLHSTEGWGDDLWYGDPGPVEIIEHFARDAAIEVERLTAENQRLTTTSSIGGVVVGRCDSNHRIISRSEYQRLNECRRIISDLDRSEHGRHAGDVESQSPTGVSEGNPHALPPGQRIGTTLHGSPITWGDLVGILEATDG